MGNGIPDFVALISPLHLFLERVYKEPNSRSKSKVRRVCLDELGWGSIEAMCFCNVKDALAHSCILAHVDPQKVHCVFTDASSSHWGFVLTQILLEDKDLSVHQQKHEPLSFLSRSFTGSPENGSSPEKELFFNH